MSYVDCWTDPVVSTRSSPIASSDHIRRPSHPRATKSNRGAMVPSTLRPSRSARERGLLAMPTGNARSPGQSESRDRKHCRALCDRADRGPDAFTATQGTRWAGSGALRPLHDPGADRRRWDGKGLPRPPSRAGQGCCDQGAAAVLHPAGRVSRPVHARGPHGGASAPSEYLDRVRRRGVDGSALHGLRVCQWRHSRPEAGGGAVTGGDDPDPGADRQCPRSRSRAGHPASRCQAVEHSDPGRRDAGAE